MTSRLHLDGVRAGYGRVEVLHGVDLDVPGGTVVALIGPNGAGKSTVLRVVAGALRARHGAVRWDGLDVTRWSVRHRVTAGLTYLPDEQATFSTLTVEENLTLFGRPGLAEDSVAAACETFPALAPLLRRRAAHLSGGERQMLALARVVLRPGRLLLLDEVSRGLAPDVTARFYDHLRPLVTPERIIVVCEQFLETALSVAGVVYELRRGVVTRAGEPAEWSGERLTAGT